MTQDPQFIGSSDAIRRLWSDVEQRLRRIAQASGPPGVLIIGERGVGKSLLAEVLHRRGPRRGGPFIKVNCANINADLAESELFGHERGAFTGANSTKRGLIELADGGILFLDEIGTLHPQVQQKLLTVIEERTFRRLGSERTLRADVWIIAASNADLSDETRFRPDLLDRLRQIVFAIPPLRQRRDDVIPLAIRFLEKACQDFGVPPATLTPEACAALRAHDWPGNVRELANLVQDVVLRGDALEITPDMLGLVASTSFVANADVRKPNVPRGPYARRDFTETEIRTALRAARGSIAKAADLLRCPRSTLRYRIDKLGLHDAVAAVSTTAPSRSLDDADGHALPVDAGPLRWERRAIGLLRLRLTIGQEPAPLWTARLLDLIQQRVEALQGVRIDVSPRGMTAVFGLVPTEDPATRATQAALAAIMVVAQDYQPAPIHPELTAAVHVQSCLVARGRGGDQVVSEDRIEMHENAERLLRACPPGAVVLSAEAAHAVERRFTIAAVRSGELDGRSVYRVLGVRSGPFTARDRLRPTFVSREQELAALAQRRERAAEAHGQLVGISGTAGVGKSRLLEEFRDRIGRDEILYLEGRCESYGTTVAYLPLLSVVRDCLEVADGVPDADAGRQITTALQRLGLNADATAPYLVHLLGLGPLPAKLAALSPEAVKARTMAALRDVITAQSRARLVVVALEDCHWIDQASAECIRSLTDVVSGHRLLVIATYRSGAAPPWLAKSNDTVELALQPLSRDASRAIAHDLLGDHALDAASVEAIVTRADGIPFFLEELIRGALASSPPSASGPLPYTIQTALMARVDRLTATERSILFAASVFASGVPSAVLREAIAEVSEHDFGASMARLCRDGFLCETDVRPAGTIAFKHNLTQGAVYASLLDEERRTLHARAIDAIRRCAPETIERAPEIAARHLTEARRLAEASEAWHRAGLRALQRCANVEALDHLEAALRLIRELPADDERTARELSAQVALAQALVATRGYGSPAVEEALVHARTLCETAGNTAQLVPVLFGLWQSRVVRAEYAEAGRIAEGLHAVATRHGGAIAQSQAQFAMGIPRFYQGDLLAARTHFEDAGRLYARSGNPAIGSGHDPGVLSRGFLGITLAILGELDRAAECGTQTLAFAREIGHPFTVASALHLACLIGKYRRDAEWVARCAGDELAIASEYGFVFWEAGAKVWSGWACVQQGSIERGLRLMQQGIDAHRHTGARLGLPAYLADYAGACVTATRYEAALDAIAEGLRLTESGGETLNAAELHRLRGVVLIALAGDSMEQGEADLRLAAEIARRQDQRLLELRASVSLARHYVSTDRHSMAKALLGPALGTVTEGRDLPDLTEALAVWEQCE